MVSGIAPHSEALLTIPVLPQHAAADAHLNMEFVLAESTNWGPKGHVVATGQVQLTKPRSLQLLRSLNPSPAKLLRAELTRNTQLSITSTNGLFWVFDLTLGSIINWGHPDPSSNTPANILTEPLRFDIYRAPTDNDRGCDFGRNWRDHRMHLAKPHLIQSSWSQPDDRTIEVVATTRIAPPVLNWALEVIATYSFTADAVHIRAHAKPTGNWIPRAWGRLGLVTAVKGCERVRWFGRGPGESYRDKKTSQLVGRWERDVEEMGTEYEFPQENGNRTDVRWVEFLKSDQQSGGAGTRLLRARYGDFEGASFSVLPYSAKDLDEAKHPYELHERKRKGDRVVHLDWMHHGLGTGSCGPETLPVYTLEAGREYEVEVVLD